MFYPDCLFLFHFHFLNLSICLSVFFSDKKQNAAMNLGSLELFTITYYYKNNEMKMWSSPEKQTSNFLWLTF